jgi:RluA family pseudouridine synthase
MTNPPPPQPTLLYQDADLLVINKPAGLLSIPDGYNPNLPTLQTVLEPEFGPLWMVHRLDKGTSGVMVLARNAEAHRQLNQAFRERQVQKTYHGLVTPTPDWSEQVLDLPLKVNADRRHRTRVDREHGKPAWTHFQVLDKFTFGARLEIHIKTGLTHQIRAHLRELRFALLGETLYNAGLPVNPLSAERAMLHARELRFLHPADGRQLAFSAPYPDDFRAAFALIRQTKDPAADF